ncbi:hypothetical protein B0H21DRAFT_780296 [Amylocystis lapponica]|nr:hypothetical protein B0H21DRAFT_780296 [Amylocystis lapponica]
MSPRRHRSSSSAVSAHGGTSRPQRAQPQPPQPPLPPSRQLGMTPAVYENNMKVLHRREPSILSIFDQFSHVCLYHHNGSKWEKQGFEGSMFLFENTRQTYPPYGFFILNRMGTDDYIRPIHPEDDMEIVGDYVMYRFYPEFTQKRVQLGLPYPIPEARRAMFDHEMALAGFEASHAEKKGRSVTVGLWMFATDAREPLKDVMMRLHSYIKQNKAYPNEFRYGPGRPPPPNPNLRTASGASNHSSASHETQQYKPPPANTSNGAVTSAGSELDKLFAKLVPQTPEPAPAPTSTSSMSVQDLFAALGGQQVARPPALSPAPAATPHRGLALLDSIFASAAPETNGFSHGPPPHTLPPARRPTSNALPQILNQDVISSLLGLSPDSRASSAAPSSVGSSSRRSGPHIYEGDNEYSEASEGEYSTSSTVLDTDMDPSLLAGGSSSGLPLFTMQQSTTAGMNGQRRVEGDVTPRAPLRGFGSSSSSPAPQMTGRRSTQQYLAAGSSAERTPTNTFSRAPTHSDSASSSATTVPATEPAARPRTLVPFEADSELWPYPRAPLDERSLDDDDADVVELDFTDTRALSDPAVFSSRLREKQRSGNGNGSGKRKTRKERAADRERERDEIERGWDDPVPAAPAPVVGKGKHPAAANGVAVAPPQANGNGAHAGMHVDAAREALLSAISTQAKLPGRDMPRNDFVRELLTLIHTDKNFVDALWHDYRARAGQ